MTKDKRLLAEKLFDPREQELVVGFDAAAETHDLLATAIDQVFVEIPLPLGSCDCGELKEGSARLRELAFCRLL